MHPWELTWQPPAIYPTQTHIVYLLPTPNPALLVAKTSSPDQTVVSHWQLSKFVQTEAAALLGNSWLRQGPGEAQNTWQPPRDSVKLAELQPTWQTKLWLDNSTERKSLIGCPTQFSSSQTRQHGGAGIGRVFLVRELISGWRSGSCRANEGLLGKLPPPPPSYPLPHCFYIELYIIIQTRRRGGKRTQLSVYTLWSKYIWWTEIIYLFKSVYKYWI